MAATPRPEETSSSDISLHQRDDDGTSEPGLTIHPAFTFEDADVILCSKEGISFRVYRICLKLSSGWFRSLYTLPQGSEANGSDPTETIFMNESAECLVVLLSITHAQDVPPLKNIDEVEEVVHAAEKYEMPGVLSFVRQGILRFAEEEPIRVYALACRWEWFEEAKIASSHTLKIDILSPLAAKSISGMSGPDLARLLVLHRRRRQCLRDKLDSEVTFYANSIPSRCQNHTCNADIIHDKWLLLKYRWLSLIDQDPEVFAARSTLLESQEVLDVINFKCHRCIKKQYNTETTLANLRSVLDALPTTVEFKWVP